MTPDDIAAHRMLIAEYRARAIKDGPGRIGPLNGWTAALDALEHAISSEGDHLSISSRRMVDTVMGERDALRQRVRDLEACAVVADRAVDVLDDQCRQAAERIKELEELVLVATKTIESAARTLRETPR